MGTSLTQTSSWTLVFIASVKTIGSFWFSPNDLAHCLSEVQITQAGIVWQFVHRIVIKSLLQRHNIRADTKKFTFIDKAFSVGGGPHWEFLRRPLKPQATFSFPGPFLIIPFFSFHLRLQFETWSFFMRWGLAWSKRKRKRGNFVPIEETIPEVCSIITKTWSYKNI